MVSRSRICGSLVTSVFIGFVLWFLPTLEVSAQQQGNKKGLESAFGEHNKRFRDLMSGDDQPRKGDVAVAKAMAEWFIYRITHRTSFAPDKVQSEFAIVTSDAMSPRFDKTIKKNRDFINRMFAPALVLAMKEVMVQNPVDREPSTAIQAASMLPSMAKLRDDKINSFLAELIAANETHDVVRLYALKAVRDAMPVTMQPDVALVLNLNDKEQNDKRATETKLVTALTGFIEVGAMKRSQGATPAEIAAVRFLRREAIISLAHAGSPAVLAVNKKQVKDVLQGPIAPTLLKVLTKNDLSPPATLQEKIEAAVGLCNMKYPNVVEYDSGVATYLVARTIIEFLDDYNRELAAISAQGASRKVPYINYKSDAKRLSESLTALADNSKTKQAARLKMLTTRILDSMSSKGTPTIPFPRFDNSELVEFRSALPALRPKDGKVFLTLPSAPIDIK